VIVATPELVFGIRYGGDIGWGDVAGNFGIAAIGNMIGGIVLVTMSRFSQARAAQSTA
jgi:formate-nitrite transporter family protein